ncbi:MAG: CHASE2 domain-containing protein [Desulfuromonadales bacterium]|nr:CHASE2 domain-containing protein [Desulfuromonadales bacterium]
MTRLTPTHHSRLPGSGRTLLAVCGAVLTICLVAFSLSQPSFVTYLDGRFFDGLTKDDTPPQVDQCPVVVALDDESLARYGRWPWPRSLVARLLARIADQKPAAVGIDVIFAEAEFSSASGRSSAAPPQLSAGDLALVRALENGPFVPGFELTFGQPVFSRNVERGLYPLNMVSVGKGAVVDPLKRLLSASGAVGSLPVFYRGAGASGFLNGAREQDGVLRRMPVLMEQGGAIYPSLALATVLRSLGSPGVVLQATWWGDLALKIGDSRIPLDERGRILLRYRKRHASATMFSASALLDGTVPRSALQGRVVLLGATATGMGDLVATPLDRLMSGVQIHGIVADNILKGDFARPAPWGYRLVAALALGLCATLVCVLFPAIRGALLLVVVAAGTWQGAVWLFHSRGLFLPPVFPLVTLFSTFSLLTLIRLFHVEKKALHQSLDLAKARDFIMTSMAALAEIRDTETGGHIMRTQRYLHALCTEISHHPRFKPLLDPEKIELISKLAVLHDIGKVGIDDKLLRKPSRFTAEEYETVKKHTAHGRDALARAELRVGDFSDELLNFAKDIAYSHHERWDGQGYPEGLRGDLIPWAARLMSVADVYDALVSRRVYKEPVPHEEAVRIISNGRGGQFDPDVVDAFLRVQASWRQIALELADSNNVEIDLK